MNPANRPRERLAARVDALALAFGNIARDRMADMPLLNRALRVEPVGFQPHAAGEAAGQAVGILITPWFMNLVALPLERCDQPRRAGDSRLMSLGEAQFDFLAAHEPLVGNFEACSLFSPMLEFHDAVAARATAAAVLASLRAAVASTPVPARRSFLFGRGAP